MIITKIKVADLRVGDHIYSGRGESSKIIKKIHLLPDDYYSMDFEHQDMMGRAIYNFHLAMIGDEIMERVRWESK